MVNVLVFAFDELLELNYRCGHYVLGYRLVDLVYLMKVH